MLKSQISIWIEILAGMYLTVVVVFFWRYPALTALLLGVGIVFWLWRYRNRADAAAMVWAALLGTPSEMLCVKYGVWTYKAPGLILGIPVWIPLIWASLFCLFRRITLTLIHLAERQWPEPKALPKKILFGFLSACILAYYVVVVFSIARFIAVVYSIFVLAGIIFWRRERDILIFIVGAILGTFGEYICMQLGFWQYQYPYFKSIGMPISLPMAWGLSAVMIGRLAQIWEIPSTKKDVSSNNTQEQR